MTRLASKVALATVAAVGLYVPTMGLPLPVNTCLRTTGVANAAPSPACASDLRDCLHASAKTGLYGVRYVTADDVARCMEAFTPCTDGGASRGRNPAPPVSTSAKSGVRGLPQHFEMKFEGISGDCQVAGTEFTCTLVMDKLEGLDSWSAKVTGTLSGLTMTGTQTTLSTSHNDGCSVESKHTGPVTYAYTAEGAVTAHVGQSEWTLTSSCTGSESGTSPGDDWTGQWTALR